LRRGALFSHHGAVLSLADGIALQRSLFSRRNALRIASRFSVLRIATLCLSLRDALSFSVATLFLSRRRALFCVASWYSLFCPVCCNMALCLCVMMLCPSRFDALSFALRRCLLHCDAVFRVATLSFALRCSVFQRCVALFSRRGVVLSLADGVALQCLSFRIATLSLLHCDALSFASQSSVFQCRGSIFHVAELFFHVASRYSLFVSCLSRRGALSFASRCSVFCVVMLCLLRRDALSFVS